MKRMIVILLWTVGAIVVIVGIVAVVGALLPVKHTATVRATYAQTPDAIWTALTNIEEYPAWRTDVRSVEMVDDNPQHPEWRETSKFGAITMEREESVPLKRLVTRIVGRESGFGGRWIYTIEPAAAGCTLTITEEGEVYNPVFRFMSRFIFGYRATMKAYATQLGARFGEKVRIAD